MADKVELQSQLSMLAWHGDETVQIDVSTWSDGTVDLRLTADGGGPAVTVTLDKRTRRGLIRELGGTPPPRDGLTYTRP